MSLGVNVGYANMVNYFGYSLTRNARYRFPYEASTYDPDTFEWLTVPVNQTVSCPYFNLAAGSGINNFAGNPAPIGVHSIVYDDVNAGTAGTFYTAPTGSALQAWLGSVQTATAIGIDTSASGPAGGLGNVALSQTATLTNGSPNVTLSAPSRNQQGMTWTFSGGGSGTYKVLSGSGSSWILTTPYSGSNASGVTVTSSGSTYVRTVVGTTVTISYWVDYPTFPNGTKNYNVGLWWYFKSPTGKWAANDSTSRTPTITNFWAFTPGDSLTTVYADYAGPDPNPVGNDRSAPYAIGAKFIQWLTAQNGAGPACLRLMEPLMIAGAGLNYQTYADCMPPNAWTMGQQPNVYTQVDYVRYYNTDPSKGPAGDNTYGWVSTKVYHPYLGFDGNTPGMGNDPTNYPEAGNYIDLTLRGGSGLTSGGAFIGSCPIEFVTDTPHGYRTGDSIHTPNTTAPFPYWIATNGGFGIGGYGSNPYGTPNSAVVGTCSVFLGSNTIIFASPQTLAAGVALTFDSSGQAYKILYSGTSQTIFTIFPVYQGTDNVTATATSTPAAGFYQSGGAIIVTGPNTFLFNAAGTTNTPATSTLLVPAFTNQIAMSGTGTLAGTANVTRASNIVTTTNTLKNQVGMAWQFSGDASNTPYTVTGAYLAGTALITNGMTTVTTSVSQSSNQIGMTWQFSGDSQKGTYTVASGSGTSWVISPAYTGTTLPTALVLTSLGQATVWVISPSYNGPSSLPTATITSSMTFQTYPSPGGTVIPYGLGAKMAATWPNCAVWIPIGPYMSDAGLQAIADEMAPYLRTGATVIPERGLEHWNYPSFDVGYYDNYYAALMAYVAAGTVVNQYYTAPGTAGGNSIALGGGAGLTGRDQAYTLLTAHQQDVLQAQFDTHNKGIKVVRLFGSQFTGDAFDQRMIGFGQTGTGITKPIPMGAIAVAPYTGATYNVGGSVNLTYKAACSSTGGNWPVAWIHDFYRHYLKYSYALINGFSTPLSTIATLYTNTDFPPLPGQTVDSHGHGRPSLYCYEAQIQQMDPLDLAPLQHDCFYHPEMANTFNALLGCLQDGGVSLANIYSLGGLWAGLSSQQLWSLMIYQQQAYGNGSANKFTTLQGGSPGDGTCYDIVNESVELPQVQAWFAVANLAPTGTFDEKPTRIQPNIATPQTFTLIGIGTDWTSDSTVSITNSITGTTTVTAGTWTAISTTRATLAVTTGLGTGTFTITIDGVTSSPITVGAKRKGWFGGMSRRTATARAS